MAATQTPNHGGLAQLGERHTGSVKVIGSSPLSSTFLSSPISREPIRRHCVVQVQSHPSEDCVIKDAEDFLREATAGWRRYGEFLDRCSFEESRRYIEPDGSDEPGSFGAVYRDQVCRHARSTFADGDEIVMATNADYAFGLSRPADNAELELREVLPIDELGRGHRITRSLVRRQSHPDYLVRDQLLEVVQKPYFDLLSIAPDPTQRRK